MTDVVSERTRLLETMAAAFARGDTSDGERLLEHALDLGIPWDEVTGAAARAIVVRYESRPSIPAGMLEA
jgi:hypothetical protein